MSVAPCLARNCYTLRLPGNLELVSNLRMKSRCRFACALGTAILLTVNFSVRAADDPLAWPPITSQTKPWAFNWWMGSAVDKTNLTHELERYAAGGLGGIHIIPIYGAKGFESKYIKYLSPEWMDMMGWTVSEANRLGMGVDMTTGTGWCFGGPQITDEDANASVVVKIIHAERGKPWGSSIDVKTAQAIVAVFSDGKSQDLTEPMKNPLIDWYWTPPTNGCDIYVISQKPSGQKVKRPAPGGEGWMLNLFYPPAMDDFLKPFTAAFANYSGPRPRAMFQDSYEYRSDWSPTLFAEFEKRRGYRLQTELPALFSKDDNDHANRVKCDYRQTISEIMAEESLPKWTAWAHSEGFITRDQAHGSPGNWLDLYAAADIPETEFFSKHRNILVSKFASSAAHTKGGNLVSSESGTWLEEHFTEKLSDVKYLMDDLFLAGINHVFYHGCCYSPDEAGWPGWHFYAATEMNPRNSIWRDAPAVNEYIARVQSVLQSGKSDNDILLYWPIEDFWMQPGDQMLPQLRVEAQGWFEQQGIGKTAHELWDRGYAFDYVSDAQLKTAKVADGKIQMPGGNYQVIVVPFCKYMPFETFTNLVSLEKAGATIIVRNPICNASGLAAFQDQTDEMVNFWRHELMPNNFQIGGGKLGDTNAFGLAFNTNGAGKIVLPEGARESFEYSLSWAGAAHETMSENGLSFVRRSFDSGWNYFIANRTEKSFDGWITLGHAAKFIVILDPMTGATGVAETRQSAANQKEVYLHLAAGESVILRALIFDEMQYGLEQVRLPCIFWKTSGQPVEITGQWNVKFLAGGPTLPADFQTAKLASWTTFADTNTQAFAGTAKYETTFDADNSKLKTKNSKFFLDLGDVRQSARVRVNGKDYGTLITSPFRVVVDNLKPAGNTLEVEVTSVAANRIRDLDRRGVKWKTFRDINIVDINYKPFDASNWPLTDCGLLGPVTLTPVTAEK